jgi:hypothetical protein
MSSLFEKLASEDQRRLHELGAFACSPFGPSFQRIITECLPFLEDLIQQGASHDELIDLIGHVGILVDDRPVAERTFSKALSRARKYPNKPRRQVLSGGVAPQLNGRREVQSKPGLSGSAGPLVQSDARLAVDRMSLLRRAAEEGEM